MTEIPLIISIGTIIKDKYIVERRIGIGTFCQIFKVIDGYRYYALKVALKTEINTDQRRLLMIRERRIHRKLNHPNIIKLYDTWDDDKYFFILLEYVDTDLFEYLQEKDILSEDGAARYFCQILRAIHYCHLKGVMHRDIKPENILLNSRDEVKLGDFGWAIGSHKAQEVCGTIEYMPPEVISNYGNHSYGFEFDIWTLGILLYEFLYGSSPFVGNTTKDTIYNIVHNKVIFPEHICISYECRNLIKRLLEKDPKKRITHIELMLDKWVSKHWTNSMIKPNKFRNYRSRSIASPFYIKK